MQKLMLIAPSHFVADHVVQRREVAERIAERSAAKPAAKWTVPRVNGGVMVIPLHGRLVHRGDEFSGFFGETPVSEWVDRVEAAVNDGDVAGIVLDVDSPGGEAEGIPEAAARMFALRGRKPIVAVANTLAASGAYWIGTAADKIFVTPSGGVGSVGVISYHVDESRYFSDKGMDITIFSAGKHKAEFVPFSPLTEEAKQHETSVITEIYGDFVDSVARHRGTSAADVRVNYGEGRVVQAVPAVKAGMADGVRTLRDVVLTMAGTVASGKRKAEARRLWARSAKKKISQRS